MGETFLFSLSQASSGGGTRREGMQEPGVRRCLETSALGAIPPSLMYLCI